MENDKNKRYVKEYEFVGGDSADTVRNWITEANERLFVVEYGGRSLFKLPFSVILVIGIGAFIFATPWAVALTVGLTVLGLLTQFSVRVIRS